LDEDKEIVEETPDEVEQRNKEVMDSAPKGEFKDLTAEMDKENELPVRYKGKVHILKWKVLGWEAQNKIVSLVARQLGSKATPTEYERLKQQLMMRDMITHIDGKPVDKSKWKYDIPYDFGELARVAFFRDTGEIVLQLQGQGIPPELIEALMKAKGIDENSDGEMVKQDAALGK